MPSYATVAQNYTGKGYKASDLVFGPDTKGYSNMRFTPITGRNAAATCGRAFAHNNNYQFVA